MGSRLWLAVLLLGAGLALSSASVAAPPREESERLRADMEGQSERLRLSVETFMVEQERRIGGTLEAQNHRIDQLQLTVSILVGLSALLAALAAILAVAWGRSRRRNRPLAP
ncbi:MAG: hypothetical protein ACM31D_11700 [Bacteroidota bacterium]